ncbi:hypothetical protein [Shewanella surugensis]|uniref:Uncharacterized protein n=1 Tax=Shewanella surugensis TaxID=212020 RepID=A0ABT0LAC1_9GAMM|nr:hypothetical protein [Shewanella surugensis]MCL1124643.1 hypothetical protein [Shewanella surugensis]
MYQFQDEFGKDFDLGFDLSDFPFLHDKSWNDDDCPSFLFHCESRIKSGEYLVLWVNYAKPEERSNDYPRYLVRTARNIGTDNLPDIVHDETTEVVFESESVEGLFRFLVPFQVLENMKSKV